MAIRARLWSWFAAFYHHSVNLLRDSWLLRILHLMTKKDFRSIWDTSQLVPLSKASSTMVKWSTQSLSLSTIGDLTSSISCTMVLSRSQLSTLLTSREMFPLPCSLAWMMTLVTPLMLHGLETKSKELAQPWLLITRSRPAIQPSWLAKTCHTSLKLST